MEIMIHYIHIIAISNQNLWKQFTPLQIAVFGYLQLNHIWLKLLIIWRFFRLWAMADNIETIENMKRCMSNNYSVSQFWRDWHCSYNRWLIRYIYIPLGGKQWAVLNVFVVFGFVAVFLCLFSLTNTAKIWHDISLTLLTWGWLISLFLLPEMAASKLVPKSVLIFMARFT
jgi:D-alanyl-lipoteichoic acid acyltransferase DltB (MBOAT superfamily)